MKYTGQFYDDPAPLRDFHFTLRGFTISNGANLAYLT